MTAPFHEDFRRDTGPVPRASERSFGLVFSVLFTAVGLLPLFNSQGVRWWALSVAAVFAGAGLAAPVLLIPLNRAWLAFGGLLHRIVSPVVLGLLFLVAVVPTGWYLRLTGADPLRLKLDRTATSYWLKRDPPGPTGASLKNQF